MKEIQKGQFPDQQDLIDAGYRLASEFDKYFVYHNQANGLLIHKKTNQVELKYSRNA
jgi:hypothetical protein